MEIQEIVTAVVAGIVTGTIGGVGILWKGRKDNKKTKEETKQEVQQIVTDAADGGEAIKEAVGQNQKEIAEVKNYAVQAMQFMQSSMNEAQQEREYLSRELDKVRAELARAVGAGEEAKAKADALQKRVTELENALAAANNTIVTITRQNETQQTKITSLERRLETGEFRTNTAAERREQNDAR